ncbi:hypothetical protein ACFL21_00480 [Patescibacteria group bacterium]
MKDKNIIEIFVKGRENDLINRYIESGPELLKKEMKVCDSEWETIFDYLVFHHNMVYKCVTANCDFFLDTYIESGMAKIREMLNITDQKYDCFVEQIFEFLAIVNEGLNKHMIQHIDRYSEAIQKRGASFLRKVLYLNKSKYDQHWKMVLDVLLHSFTSSVAAHQNFEKCMRVFTNMVNSNRDHRLPFKSGLFIS